MIHEPALKLKKAHLICFFNDPFMIYFDNEPNIVKVIKSIWLLLVKRAMNRKRNNGIGTKRIMPNSRILQA